METSRTILPPMATAKASGERPQRDIRAFTSSAIPDRQQQAPLEVLSSLTGFDVVAGAAGTLQAGIRKERPGLRFLRPGCNANTGPGRMLDLPGRRAAGAVPYAGLPVPPAGARGLPGAVAAAVCGVEVGFCFS